MGPSLDTATSPRQAYAAAVVNTSPLDFVRRLEQLAGQPGVLVGDHGFRTVVTFLSGADHAAGGSWLVGFREWLVVRVDAGKAAHWSQLVTGAVAPGKRPADLDRAETERAIRQFCAWYQEYWEARTSRGGLRRIFFEFEGWLREQPDYDPENPYI